jgi:voltage-gated potassium channel
VVTLRSQHLALIRPDKGISLARRLFFVSLLFLSTLAGGTLGYRFLEGWNLFDSFYMATITVTTVGFSEVRPLSPSGRIFTGFLILLGVGSITYSFGVITNYLIAGEFRGYLRERRVSRLIASMSDHFVVCGFGRMGQEVCRELQRERRTFVVVDEEEDSIEQARQKGYTALQRDPRLDETLRKCGVERACGLAAVSDADAKNLMIVISSRGLNQRLAIVARVSAEDAPEKFIRAGADTVFLPYRTGGIRVAQMLVRPAVVGFLEDILHNQSSVGLSIEGFTLEKSSGLLGMTLAEARLREETGAFVVGLRRSGGSILSDLEAATLLQEGDTVIALGRQEQLQALSLRLRSRS